MSVSATLLAEFDQETPNTRKVLERCPESKFDWTPHQKSWNLGRLATHLARMMEWGLMTVETDEFNFEPGEYKEEVPATTAQLLSGFDANVKAFRERLAALSDEDSQKPWALKSSGSVIFSMPKAMVIRSFVFNHAVHHRAQLTVYLRLLDIPVPAIYGPSADETGG